MKRHLVERGHDEHDQSDEHKRYWKETIDFYQERFNMFLHRMHIIQGMFSSSRFHILL
jgi:hypothetical protein